MSAAGSPPRRHRVLLGLAAASAILGGAVLVLTALGYGHADVRGVRLTGTFRLGFLVGLGASVGGCAAAAVGFARRRAWAVPLFAAVWPTFALVCLALDRLTPAPGAGRPLAFYLVGVGLAPALAIVALGRSRRASRA